LRMDCLIFPSGLMFEFWKDGRFMNELLGDVFCYSVANPFQIVKSILI
jgi:hypothetical protein